MGKLSSKAIALRDQLLALPYVPISMRLDRQLNYVHFARCRMVRALLPAAAHICDLGGANSPLYLMGYKHSFSRMVMVDLPVEERHEVYGEMVLHPHEGHGVVEVLYSDMTRLDTLRDASFDLVWSGQSIEHVSETDGRRMCAEALRVLRPGGYFCLDTPNGKLSRLHAATAGLQFIHPEHQIEYEPQHLQDILIEAGFEITDRYGICHMPKSAQGGTFHYEEFIFGDPITPLVDESYIQFYSCRKPAGHKPAP